MNDETDDVSYEIENVIADIENDNADAMKLLLNRGFEE